jgi:hypothetical protein
MPELTEEAHLRDLRWPGLPRLPPFGCWQQVVSDRLQRDPELLAYCDPAPTGDVVGLAGVGAPIGLLVASEAAGLPRRQGVAALDSRLQTANQVVEACSEMRFQRCDGIPATEQGFLRVV